MKKKILHVINSMTIGGAETLLANSLSPGGLSEHTENYLAYLNKSSYLLDIIDKDVKIISLDYKGGFDIIRVLKQIRRIIIDHKIDIVHSHLTPAGVYTHLVCPASVPQVHTIHSTYSMEKETSPVKRFMDREFFFKKKNCNIINLSDFTKKDFLNAIPFKGKIFVLNNFVADRYFNFPPKKYVDQKKSLRLIAAGNLKTHKNFEYLLEVFKLLAHKEIYLDIYGGGDKKQYETFIRKNNLKISMMGPIDDLATVIHKYDLFIMPSKFEGFPLAVFEAMAAGTPLLLSDIAPLKSVVKNHALYFKLDETKDTAALITDIFQGNIDVNTMALQAKGYAIETVKREKYIKHLLDIYGQL